MNIALGTAQFGMKYGVANRSGCVALPEVKEILGEAIRHQIDTIDTASTYGDSEQTLGAVGVGGWRIVGKLPAIPHDSVDIVAWALEQVQTSLERLGVDQMHGLLLHRPAQLLEARGAELYKALGKIRDEGYTSKIGISIYDPTELDQILGRYPVDLVQAPVNILDRRMLNSGWFGRLKSWGVEIHARSIFLQGLLLMPETERPLKFRRWQHLWVQWDNWLRDCGLTPLAACLKYVRSIPEIDQLIVGVDGLRQFREIVAVDSSPLPSLPTFPETVSEELVNPSMWNLI